MRWTVGVFALCMTPLTLLAVLAGLFQPAIAGFVGLVSVVTLIVTMAALLYSPAVTDPPYEERLRMEEWVAAGSSPTAER